MPVQQRQVSKRTFSSVEKAILTTILYSDIFSFAITKDELWRLLISKKPITKNSFEVGLKNLLRNSSSLRQSSDIVYKAGYYCLDGREYIINERINNLQEVENKRALVEKVIPQLAKIPTILFIGISGGLAAGSAKKEDDIDLFIIAKKGTLFFTRFSVLLRLQLLGRRRKRRQKYASDMFCPNFLVDENSMAFSTENQDIYTAREIAQLVPIFERENMYRIFLTQNSWIEQFLPNVFKEKRSARFQGASAKKIFLLDFLEKASRFIQISYMKTAQTTEIITNTTLAFHPNDYRSKILAQLRLKMQHLGLLTKL
ncbi:MAG: hypothetical protein ACR2LN_01300 [Candidatus Levyibacteriota bacterium]